MTVGASRVNWWIYAKSEGASSGWVDMIAIYERDDAVVNTSTQHSELEVSVSLVGPGNVVEIPPSG